MRKVTLMFLIVTLTTILFAQQRPPAEIDNTLRATVQLMMGPADADYKGFIEKRFSSKAKASENLMALESELKKTKQATRGAGGVDIAVDNDVFKIIFSEGNDATVVIFFDKDEVGKISSLKLIEKKDPSHMTEDEKFVQALEVVARNLESLPKLETDENFNVFIDKNFTSSFLANQSRPELITMLRKLRLAVASAMMISSQPLKAKDKKGMVLEFRGPKSANVSFALEETAPYRIQWFEVDQVEPSSGDEKLIPMTWTDYESKIENEVGNGFSGTIYIVRNGKIVHAKGYGLANREDGIRNSITTVFDIGSVPIDFTRAAILKLVDMGKVSYEDPISKFFKMVPSDKRSMTLGHLMTDKSGLPNFHHDPDQDEDFDLSWITREEAVKRMLSRPLLAPPGEEFLPSHSGYGLLAAIVELVCGNTYEGFLQEHFFKPMGMNNTGPYGKAANISSKVMAVGYGKQVSSPNIPSEWGATSWLIKGSGGMVSNPADLYLWNRELQTGKYLSPASKEKFRFGRPSVGGTERGFLTCYQKDGLNTVVICSNASREDYPDTMTLFKSLLNLYK